MVPVRQRTSQGGISSILEKLSYQTVIMKQCYQIRSLKVDTICIGLRILPSFLLSFLPVGHTAGLDGFVGCINLTYLRDSLTNIHIRVLSPGRPSLGRMPHSPYCFLRGGEHISLFCPPSTCVCMCAVNAGECVIDLFVKGWASTCPLLCLVTGNNANTDKSPVSTSPICIPRIRLGGLQAGDEKSPQILSHFSDEPPRPGIEPGSPV